MLVRCEEAVRHCCLEEVARGDEWVWPMFLLHQPSLEGLDQFLPTDSAWALFVVNETASGAVAAEVLTDYLVSW